MRAVGFGAVSVCGRGRACHESAMQRRVSQSQDIGRPGSLICRVPDEILSDRVVFRKMRRADRFSKMAVLAAHDAWLDAGGSSPASEDGVGVVLTTSLGPHYMTFKVLDDILDYGDSAVSPRRFSHSVHSTAASYVTTTMGIRGPTMTLTKFQAPFPEGIALAEAWLAEGRCMKVLVGYVEEVSPPMEYIATALHARGGQEKLQEFNLSPDPVVDLSEGAVFVVMTGCNGPLGAWCDLRDMRTLLDRMGK